MRSGCRLTDQTTLINCRYQGQYDLEPRRKDQGESLVSSSNRPRDANECGDNHKDDPDYSDRKGGHKSAQSHQCTSSSTDMEQGYKEPLSRPSMGGVDPDNALT